VDLAAEVSGVPGGTGQRLGRHVYLEEKQQALMLVSVGDTEDSIGNGDGGDITLGGAHSIRVLDSQRTQVFCEVHLEWTDDHLQMAKVNHAPVEQQLVVYRNRFAQILRRLTRNGLSDSIAKVLDPFLGQRVHPGGTASTAPVASLRPIGKALVHQLTQAFAGRLASDIIDCRHLLHRKDTISG
jgi:hypothetical protein